GAYFTLQSQALSGPSCGSLQGLHGGQTSLDQILEFLGVDVVLVSTSIGAGHNFDASGEGLLQAGDVVRIQLTATCAHVRGADFAVEDVHGEVGNEEGATLGHHGDEFGIFVQITAVLDGVNPGFDGHAQAWSTQGVAHDTPAQGM